MKIVTPKTMASIEAIAYSDGFKEETFMEQAGLGIANAICDLISAETPVLLLCGKGNNTGDAYVAGRILLQKGHKVYAIQITDIEESSPLCKQNHKKFLNAGGKITDTILEEGIILDGLFGTGFHGSIREPFATLIEQANATGLPIIAIDIPSGLNGETGICENLAICASVTLFLGLPKIGFFLNDGWNLVGHLEYVDFGLPKKYSDEAQSDYTLIRPENLQLPAIKRDRHKYEAGLVVGLAGSKSMPGAALLASEASLRGGAGIVHLLHQEGMEAELSSSLYEVIKIPYTSSKTVIEKINHAKAAFIGPGLGREKRVRKLLKKVLANIEVPCVLDADALTIIAEENIPLPKDAILTPHHGEMKRLLCGKQVDHARCQEYANTHQVTLILKGGPTFIFHPNTPVTVNPTGCPGMATAGSGDVLTGLLAALIAEGLPLYEAAQLGVYLHGFAGELAEQDKTPYSMIASDITHYLDDVFRAAVSADFSLEKRCKGGKIEAADADNP